MITSSEMQTKSRSKSILLFISIFITLTGFAQIPSGYYDDAQGKAGEELKTALYYIINDHNSQSYSSLWYHFENTDKKPNGKVWDMYSDVPGGTPPYQYTFGNDQCGSYSGEGDCYNREHSFPKSWYNDASPMYTDLFHLVPSDGYVNGKRSNYPYGETNSPSWTSQNGSKVGSNSTSGYSGTVFEPIDEYKGDFARGYLYMATRYENVISNWNSDMLAGNSYPAYADWALELLISWHNSDPVSQKEIDRNNEIYYIQDNRNPYIDHPEYAQLVWGGSAPPSISNVQFSPSTPEPNEVVTVTALITDDGTITDATLVWGTSSTTMNNNENMTASGSTYSASIPAQSFGTSVFFLIEATDNDNLTSTSATTSYTVGTGSYDYLILPYSENFEANNFGEFEEFTEVGPDQYWHVSEFEDNSYSKMSNYDGSQNVANTDWLILKTIKWHDWIDTKISFETAMKDYDGSNIDLELQYSTDFELGDDPTSASWTDISDDFSWSPGEYEWEFSGEENMDYISENFVTFAFKYTAPSGANNGRTWEMDNFSITATPSSATEEVSQYSFVIVPNPATDIITIHHSDRAINSVRIINQVGVPVKTVNSVNNETNTIHVSDLSAGLYFVQLISNNTIIATEKMVIR